MLPLFEHQKESVAFFLERPIGADFSDAGTGKTRVQIELIAARYTGDNKVLILAPKSLMYPAWKADFKKFAPFLRTQIIEAAKRGSQLEVDADVYITNIDAIRWLAKMPTSYFDSFDTLIIDESSAYKNVGAARTKKIIKFAERFHYRYIMSGTPNPNSVTELWSQYAILDGGQRLGTNFYRFRSQTTTSIQVGPSAHARKYTDNPDAAGNVSSLVSDITIRHKLEECLDLPEHTVREVSYNPSRKLLNEYNDLKKDSVIFVQNNVITAVNAAVLLQKLLQVASGAVYNEKGEYVVLERERYELVSDLVEEVPQCIVFFNWRHQKEELIKEFKKRKLSHALVDGTTKMNDRNAAVEKFQAGYYQIFLCHPQTAAHGLTLTAATRTIFASPTFNAEHVMQGRRRAHRAGQTKKTETLTVLANDTLDNHVYERLSAKIDQQQLLFELLRM